MRQESGTPGGNFITSGTNLLGFSDQNLVVKGHFYLKKHLFAYNSNANFKRIHTNFEVDETMRWWHLISSFMPFSSRCLKPSHFQKWQLLRVLNESTRLCKSKTHMAQFCFLLFPSAEHTKQWPISRPLSRLILRFGCFSLHNVTKLLISCLYGAEKNCL